MKKIKRRDFLRYTGIIGVSTLAGGTMFLLEGCSSQPNVPDTMIDDKTKVFSLDPTNPENFTKPLRVPQKQGVFGLMDVPSGEFSIRAEQDFLELIPGKQAKIDVFKVEMGTEKYINPVLKIKKGQTFMGKLENRLDENAIIHWHGLSLDWKMDGHPSYEVASGGQYNYNFTVSNRGGTYWYHPHPMNLTAKQAYLGMAGFFIVEDDDEINLRKTVGLELGQSDIPLVIQDKNIDEKGVLVYKPDSMEKMMGLEGQAITVNFTPNPYLDIERRIYRFRILNGSNARIYRLAFEKNKKRFKFYVIGTDGGLLEKMYEAQEAFLAPGERLDILVDFSLCLSGEQIYLKSLAFDPMENEGEPMEKEGIEIPERSNNMNETENMDNMSGMDGMEDAQDNNSKLKLGDEFYILSLQVTNETSPLGIVPQNLSDLQPVTLPVNTPIRKILLSLSQNKWLINGETFNMDRSPITVSRNTTEIWEIKNDNKSMPHPMHLHGFLFRVVERINSPKQIQDIAVSVKGLTVSDLGWKDTVLLWPGETVKILIEFKHDFSEEQLYLFHCHNLEHEDMGMMINCLVK